MVSTGLNKRLISDQALSQAKYFYNLLFFFHYQNFVLAYFLEVLNFRITTKSPMFF